MKHISIWRDSSKELIKEYAEKRNLKKYLKDGYIHPMEDYLLSSEESKVFVVADGVTLNALKILVEDNSKYPNPSPAGDVAKIFCEAVIKEGNNIDVKEVFERANDRVWEYNKKIGKTEYCGMNNPTGYYSATGSFMTIKDNKVCFASICDAYFAHFDKNMNLKFMSSGTCSPYAVINGEKRMSEHLEIGVRDLEEGDRVFVFTDGFENHIKDGDFLNLFKNFDESLENRIDKLSEKKNLEDPDKYGHERSLISVVI